MAFEARWYQQEAVSAWWSYFNSHSGNPLIVMPTGSGKSPVLGMLMKDILTMYPRQRILVLTHVKELVEQDTQAICRHWPGAPVSIYSSSVGRKDFSGKVVVASVQSLVNNLEEAGKFSLIFIDEAHLVPAKSETTYRKVISHFKEVNPKVKVSGLTATPYRLAGGHLLDCGIFTDICYDLTTPDSFSRLVNEGFLTRLVNKRVATKIDTSAIGTRMGDYIQTELEQAVDQNDITSAAIRETIAYGHDRKHMLVFAVSVEHAYNIAAEFEIRGISSVVVHGGLNKKARESALADFKAGEFRVCVNVNVLTTGFDYPEIDCLVILRPSTSVALWVQILGRGLRIAPGKENCLVLDFTSNTIDLGPIDDPAIPPRVGKKKRAGVKRSGPGGKECPTCHQVSGFAALTCKHPAKGTNPKDNIICGHEFTFKTSGPAIATEASNEEVMTDGQLRVVDKEVTLVNYALFQKAGRPDSIKVVYYSGLEIFTTWVNVEAYGSAQQLAEAWWKNAAGTTPPTTCEEFIARKGEIALPKQIKVWIKRPYPQIMNYDWGNGFGKPRG